MFANYPLLCLQRASSYVNIILEVLLPLFTLNCGEMELKVSIKMPKWQNNTTVFVQKGLEK